MASEQTILTVPGPNGDRDVRISSPSRVLWPDLGLTKLDLANYMVAVGAPFIEANGDRPVSLQRYSENVDGEFFFSKNPPKGAPDFIRSVKVVYPSARSHPQLVLDEPAAAVWAVQMNTVVFHPWPSRTGNTDNPDQLRIDLDPQPGTDFDDAVPVAVALRDVLTEAGLATFVKTSGNRGLHVFAPIRPDHEFLDVRHAVIAACRELERRMPDKVTTKWWKEERGTRIFLDFNQANRDRTMAGAYSPRPLPHAPVSCPVTWDELGSTDPKDFTILTVPDRLKSVGDPWAGMHEEPGSIGTLLEWWDRDLASGLGELPFPPDYPKMPGEPPRVQPSRARKQD
ncbi:non-homologous end-joining DNA ligase [Pseudarthrobacter sp. J75]|uniref:non-homologous end-joining DNA ligase n=1 Tax=unclassified Pseudarthrobacter TaxID=2647000 RepID=UPI002E80A9EB|nr:MULTISPECIES: non-homologous end-joining DNA ligase [unclassified Pseudarthrobacter]MEE2523013.1 non-homologous end-joining DNA ligase [Pseudarthrobacter sp. J47]MEE2529696.1 non-homologous end-joining DNA ligase [Pseudarthrobacter sp. J75]